MSRNFPGDDYDIDMEKLSKLEKMIIRVDNDIQKMQLDNDKVQVTMTLKKTHDIYQLILSELHFQLTEMKLEGFGNLFQKIFLGENTLLNSLLKLKTNLEYNPRKMIENLESLGSKVRRRNSSSQVNKAREDPEFLKIASENIAEMKKRKMNKTRFGRDEDFVPKVYSDKFTDTEIDKQDARSLNNVLKKAEELDEIKRDIDESSQEMENFLKDRKMMNFDQERSKAEQSLKTMLKDLTLKKRRAEQIEREGEKLLNDPAIEAERKARQAQNAALIFGTAAGQGLKDVKQVQTSNIEIQTDKDPLAEKYDKLNVEMKQKMCKMVELEKKIRETQKDSEIYKEQTKKLNEKISELMNIQRKRDDEAKLAKKENKLVMGDKEKEKFKKLVEENYKMKLKFKELVDEIKLLEKENKSAMDKFRHFIMNSNLTDEQKRMLLGKVEELFTMDLSKRLNLRELEHMAKIDNEMLKDPFLRSIIGDPVAMVKRLKQEEKDRIKMKQNPNYNPDFDPALLEDGQRIITRKVKKKVRRLNSKGEWVEEEIEVEEECVVDKNGNIIRTREKPKDGPVMDPAMQAFINQHGGLAIGGAKFTLPQKPGKPMAKNGQPIKEGEWFVDQNGNKVRMTRNSKGEEQYEIQEEYIDEYGNKQVRNKKMVITKDKDGNEIITEEFIDPKTGKKVTVQKKVFKDKDGNEVIEEVTTDAFGRKTTKRTKVLKDKDGNEYIEEEIIDEFGNKTIVRKKKMKDANGNDVWVTETINADGSRTIVTEKIGANGERIVIEEKIDKNGKKTVTEKRMVIGADGKQIMQEVTYDEFGNKIVKNTKQIVDKDGNIVTVEETVDANGNKITKMTKVILDKDGNRVIVEETVDANGNKITKMTKQIIDKDGNKVTVEETIDQYGNKVTKMTKQIVDKDGNVVTVEETVDQYGNKVTKMTKQIVDKDGNVVTIEETIDQYGNKVTKKIKRMFDKDGNEIIEEEIIDANGNRIIIRTKKNKDGSVEEERYNPETGERIIVKKRIDANGREIIEETRIDKNGNAVTTTKVITVDKFGNKIVEESYIDPKTGLKVTVRKKITKDKDGNEIVEETRIDENGNVITIKKKTYKDKDGKEVTEEEITDANGNKIKIKTKVYRDADGNEITEEERIDEFGNKVIIRRKKDKDGKETIEEIHIDKNGNKTIIQRVINKDGTVEETIIDSKGNITKTKRKLGTDDKEIQVNTASSKDLEQMLISLGCSVKDAAMITKAIMDFINKGTPFVIGDEEEYAKLRGISHKHSESLNSLKQQRKKEMEEIRKNQEEERLRKLQEIQAKKDRRKRGGEDENDDDLDVIDDKMTEEEQMAALYKRMKQNGGQMGELIRNIRNQLGLSGDDEIDLDKFKDYFNKYKIVHSKCGEHCPHLKRFYAKLGFIQNKYKRRFLKMKDTKINAFQGKASKLDKLPKIHHNNSSSSETKSLASTYSRSRNMSQSMMLQSNGDAVNQKDNNQTYGHMQTEESRGLQEENNDGEQIKGNGIGEFEDQEGNNNEEYLSEEDDDEEENVQGGGDIAKEGEGQGLEAGMKVTHA